MSVTQVTLITINGILLVTGLVIFAIALWKRNRHPFKSRGFMPFWAIVAFIVNKITFISMFGGMLSGTHMETVNLLLCIMEGFIQSPQKIGFLFLVAFQGFRFFIVDTINRSKESIGIRMERKGETVSLGKYKWLKFVSSTWAMLCGFFLVVIIFDGALAIVGFLYGSRIGVIFKCPVTGDNAQFGDTLYFIIFVAITACMVLLITAVIIYDLIKNNELLCACKWKEYFWYTDPLYFRIEYMGLLIIIFISLVFSVALSRLPEQFKFAERIATSIFSSVIIYFFVGFSLITTIKWDLRAKRLENVDEIQKILSNEHIKKLFKEFARKEW